MNRFRLYFGTQVRDVSAESAEAAVAELVRLRIRLGRPLPRAAVVEVGRVRPGDLHPTSFTTVPAFPCGVEVRDES